MFYPAHTYRNCCRQVLVAIGVGGAQASDDGPCSYDDCTEICSYYSDTYPCANDPCSLCEQGEACDGSTYSCSYCIEENADCDTYSR